MHGCGGGEGVAGESRRPTTGSELKFQGAIIIGLGVRFVSKDHH